MCIFVNVLFRAPCLCHVCAREYACLFRTMFPKRMLCYLFFHRVSSVVCIRANRCEIFWCVNTLLFFVCLCVRHVWEFCVLNYVPDFRSFNAHKTDDFAHGFVTLVVLLCLFFCTCIRVLSFTDIVHQSRCAFAVWWWMFLLLSSSSLSGWYIIGLDGIFRCVRWHSRKASTVNSYRNMLHRTDDPIRT